MLHALREMPKRAILCGFMAHTLLTRLVKNLGSARAVRSIALGALCSVFAFAAGMQTSGDVQTFEKSQAAVQTDAGGVRAVVSGDMDDDGVLEPADAERLLILAEGMETATPKEIHRGDLNGDGRLSTEDVLRVLHALSLR